MFIGKLHIEKKSCSPGKPIYVKGSNIVEIKLVKII